MSYSETETIFTVEWGSGHRWRTRGFDTEGEARVFIDGLGVMGVHYFGDIEVKLIKKKRTETWEIEEIPI